MDGLPDATGILGMSADDFDQRIGAHITTRKVATGTERPDLDWEHIADLRTLSPDFRDLFEWISYCLTKKKPYSFEGYEKLRSIEDGFA